MSSVCFDFRLEDMIKLVSVSIVYFEWFTICQMLKIKNSQAKPNLWASNSRHQLVEDLLLFNWKCQCSIAYSLPTYFSQTIRCRSIYSRSYCLTQQTQQARSYNTIIIFFMMQKSIKECMYCCFKEAINVQYYITTQQLEEISWFVSAKTNKAHSFIYFCIIKNKIIVL